MTRRVWRVLSTALVVAFALVATRGFAQEEPGTAPVAGPAAEPAIPGALGPGVIPLPKRLVGEAPVGGDSLRVRFGPSERVLDPVAVPDVICDGDAAGCGTIADVLRNDLRISGCFKVLPPKTYLADMSKERLTETKWADWSNVGATYLIKADLKGSGPFDVSFRLYNVPEEKAYKLAKQDRKGLSAKDLRRAVHDFCNEVVELVSGSPADFGTRILYTVKTGLQTKAIGVMDMDGYGAHGIVGGSTIHMLPSWAPGGGVLYTSFKTGWPSLWLGKRRLAKGTRQFRKGRFSPDGSVIAVSADVEGQSDIFLMSPSGELMDNLTRHMENDVSPTWSPDGSRIAFVSDRTMAPQIYIMNRDGSGQRRLTMAGSYNSTPDWGPNGLIVFAGMDEGSSDIFTVDEAGLITRLTQDQGNNWDPSWSPSGRYIAFVSDREGERQLWIMTADGRYQYKISDRKGFSMPAWQR